MSSPLSESLRRETKALHARAERSGIMSTLLRGELQRSDYCALLRNLHALYEALEAGLDSQREHEAIRPIYSPPLHRAAALSADLSTLHGDRWHSDLPVLAATREYVDRLQQVARTDVHLLAAHAYVRFLGDLSGGRILQRIIATSVINDATHGNRFYAYDGEDTSDLASRFRLGLDAIPLNEGSAADVVDEAKLGFSLHERLFNQLADTSLLRQSLPNKRI
ncbi:MAG: heme oxygenase (biliverdin-producing) [Burkholderiaceae bacterium]